MQKANRRLKKRDKRLRFFSAFQFALLIALCTINPVEASISNRLSRFDTSYSHGMVVSASHYASQIGVTILKKGGNAIDAAVAVQFALAVVYPNAGNIGGGGFMVIRTSNGKADCLDFREEAPANSSHNMYQDLDGKVIQEASTFGFKSAGVPGSVDGMVEAHKRYGKLPWKELVQPAIDLAVSGFKLSRNQAELLNSYASDFKKANGANCVLLPVKGVWEADNSVRQPALASTLIAIRDKGRAGFYEGHVALSFAEDIRKGSGIITTADLKSYHAIWRKPLTGNYKGYTIISMPPPSSGGLALLQLLASISSFPVSAYGLNKTKEVHLFTEAERRVYADRSYYMGDPDFVEMPILTLISQAYNISRMKTLDSLQATPSIDVKAGKIEGYANLERHIHKEKMETTHFSIIDKDGNAVSVTTTLNGNFGSKVVLQGTGIVLNNEMDDFSVKPGYANEYGLIGAEANAIQPHKRMLSSMTPSIIERNGKLFMVLGSPGGATIITTVFQTIINVIDFKMSIQQAVAAPRFHSQWLPDEILAEEKAFSPQVRNSLEKMKHKIHTTSEIGRMDAILVNSRGEYEGGADPRGDDSASGY